MRSLVFATLLLAGCGLGSDSLYTGSISEKNINNLARLTVGMDQMEVRQVMRQPYEQECFQVNGDTYELWYYVTTVTGLGQTRMVPQNLTPLAFKNGTLIGWGYDYYRWLTREQKLEKKRPVKAPAEEDKGLEKALEPVAPPAAPLPVNPVSPVSMGKPPAKPDEPKKESKPPLSPEDEEMLERESEQNFNYG